LDITLFLGLSNVQIDSSYQYFQTNTLNTT